MEKREPLYYQIYRDLRQRIESSEYTEGTQVPTESELEKEYGVSRITSKRALGQLAREGFIERIPGRGSFVRSRKRWAIDESAEPSSRQRQLIGFVTQGIGASHGTQLLVGVEGAAGEADLSLLLRFTGGDPHVEEEAIKEMVAHGCTGLVLFPVNGEIYSPSLLQAYLAGLPVVLVDRFFPGLDIPSITSDNKQAAYTGVSHLLELGHKQVLLLSPRPHNTVSIEERIDGYVEAFTERNLPIDHSLILDDLTTNLPGIPQRSSYENDAARIADLLHERPNVTAVMALEYELAVAARSAAESVGKAVPEDLSIVCFDHPPSSLTSRPLFTHLRQNEAQMGRVAVEILLDMVNGEGAKQPANGSRRIHLPVELVLGTTTAVAPAQAPSLKTG